MCARIRVAPTHTKAVDRDRSITLDQSMGSRRKQEGAAAAAAASIDPIDRSSLCLSQSRNRSIKSITLLIQGRNELACVCDPSSHRHRLGGGLASESGRTRSKQAPPFPPRSHRVCLDRFGCIPCSEYPPFNRSIMLLLLLSVATLTLSNQRPASPLPI